MPRWLVVLLGIAFFPITVVILIVRSRWSMRTKLLLSVAWTLLFSAVLVTSGSSSQNLTSQTAQVNSPNNETRPSESLPSPSPSNIPSPSVKPSPTLVPPSPSPTPPRAVAQTGVSFVNAPLTAARGSNATLEAKTAANISCSIEVDYKSGASTAAGLVTKNSDGAGNVSWTWKVGSNTTRGSWPITVTCGNATAQTHINVT
jgi:hypothetical protein